MALGWLWGGFEVALYSQVDSFVVALGWLCTPESMPSICLVYGFLVALGGLPDHSALCIPVLRSSTAEGGLPSAFACGWLGPAFLHSAFCG